MVRNRLTKRHGILIALVMSLSLLLAACDLAAPPSETVGNTDSGSDSLSESPSANDSEEWPADSQPVSEGVVMEPEQTSYPYGTYKAKFILTATQPGCIIECSTGYTVYRLEGDEEILVNSVALDDAITHNPPSPDGYAQGSFSVSLSNNDDPALPGRYRVYYSGIPGLELVGEVVVEAEAE